MKRRDMLVSIVGAGAGCAAGAAAWRASDISVRIVPSSNPVFGWSVEDAQSGRVLDGVIPIRYSGALRATRPGDQIEVFIYSDDPPQIDPTTRDVRTERARFHVVSVEIPRARA